MHQGGEEREGKETTKSRPKKKVDISTEITDVKRIVREYYEKPYTYKFRH